MDVNWPVLLLPGPTASGKTALALALAERLPIEIVSVDSGMVYRGMDIGTAKPTRQQMQQVPHHLVDVHDPAEPFSAALFLEKVRPLVADILQRDKLPVLVGGTMLYFRVLVQGLVALPEANAALRARLDAEAAELGWPMLHARLYRVDPQTALRLSPNDRQRIQRALEIFELTGVPSSVLYRSDAEDADKTHWPWPNTPLWFALVPQDRSWLHRRIEQRLEVMWQAGLVQEVEALYQRGDLQAQLPALRAVGYRQVWSYLQGTLTAAAMREQTLYATRQLAKRQLTWLRSFRGMITQDPGACSVEEIAEQLELIVKKAQNGEEMFFG